MNEDQTYKCAMCGQTKRRGCFYPNDKSLPHSSPCKPCRMEQQRVKRGMLPKSKELRQKFVYGKMLDKS